MTSDESKNDGYSVGYGKPPKHSQFQKGQSGNRRGRQKGSKNFATIIQEELNQKVTVTENGFRRRITKKQAIIKQIINKAALGDPKTTQMMIQISKDSGDLKLPTQQKQRPIITMIIEKPRPGEDRSYRDGFDIKSDSED